MPADRNKWVARYNGPGNYDDRAGFIAIDGSGNIYAVGSSYGLRTYQDYVTIKYNSAGQDQWIVRCDGPLPVIPAQEIAWTEARLLLWTAQATSM